MSGIEQFIARTRCARRTDRRVKLVDEILSVLTAGHKHIFTLAYHNDLLLISWSIGYEGL
jgi:hypothetical protein